MKRGAAIIVICLSMLAAMTGCEEAPQADRVWPDDSQNGEAKTEGYTDGIYRGFYKSGDLEEMAVQFELLDGSFTAINFRSIKYKDGNYLSDGATDIQKQIAAQYRQAGDYLIGKDTSAIEELLEPDAAIASDMDAVTGATLNTNKLAAALWDGLERNVFKPIDTSVVMMTGQYPDGHYSGAYDDGGVEQISVQLEMKGNSFVSVDYKSLNYGDKNYLDADASGVVKEIADQYKEAAKYLEGKPLSALADLYEPGDMVEDRDAVTGPTLRTNKLISAINNALAAGPESE